MPKLVLICGPQAVGKMTVCQELTKITDLKLFHNHMTIVPLVQIFQHKQQRIWTNIYICMGFQYERRLGIC